MQKGAWRSEVAQLLEQCAEALRATNDRQAIASFGTVVSYLHRAEDAGDRSAVAILDLVRSGGGDGNTQRFSFAPGELEAIAGHKLSK